MAHVQHTTFCSTHPDRTADVACDYCGKPICQGCRIEDVVAEEVFCSYACKEARSRARSSVGLKTDDELLAAYGSPIRDGWALWFRSLGPLVIHLTPVALMMGILAGFLPDEEQTAEFTMFASISGIGVLVLFAYAFALVQVVLSQQYVGLIHDNLYTWTLRRFLPWCLTTAIVTIAAFVGFLLFVIPGIYLSLRLYWVGEYALVHRRGPIQAIRESWRVTNGGVGSIFKFQFLAGLAANLIFFAGAIVIGIVVGIFQVAGGSLELVENTFLLLALLIGYGAFEGPEVIYFYGMRAEQSGSLAASTRTLGLESAG